MEPSTVHTLPEPELKSTAILTTALALAAATMTFGALIAVFFIRSGGREWGHLEIPITLWFTTGILLASSVTVERARRALEHGDQPGTYRQFLASWTLGVLFLAGQITAWVQVVHSGIPLKDNSHLWFIFLFVALHGLHILLGLTGLTALAYRTHERVSGRKYQARTRALALGVSIFWHYLDFLWLLLFSLLLFWRR